MAGRALELPGYLYDVSASLLNYPCGIMKVTDEPAASIQILIVGIRQVINLKLANSFLC
jgi:hypothetical protein